MCSGRCKLSGSVVAGRLQVYAQAFQYATDTGAPANQRLCTHAMQFYFVTLLMPCSCLLACKSSCLAQPEKNQTCVSNKYIYIYMINIKITPSKTSQEQRSWSQRLRGSWPKIQAGSPAVNPYRGNSLVINQQPPATSQLLPLHLPHSLQQLTY